jgi:hypothetical protein
LKDQSEGRCIAMKENGFWSNYDCNDKYSSICVTRNALFPTTTSSTTPAPIPCPPGWTDAADRCYKVFLIS